MTIGTKKRLNIGCGTDIRPGYVNIDSARIAGVDHVIDIYSDSWPFTDGSASEVLALDVLEHMENPAIVIEKAWRVLEQGGVFKIRLPHFTSKGNAIDPTHRRVFSVSTFNFFLKSGNPRPYYFSFAFDRIETRRITFELSSRFFFYNKLIAPLVNYSYWTQCVYESTGFSRIFPAQNIEITLIK